MKNLDKVSELRGKLSDKTSGIAKRNGIYCWWFEKGAATELIRQLGLSCSEIARIRKRDIEGNEYWALYFGISKDMLNRAKWHILQKHTVSAVKHGTLSTLRQTLGSLLECKMSEAGDAVNEFIDKNCYWEWEYNDNPEAVEREELSKGDVCYPLNIKDNKTVRKEVVNTLKKLRKDSKDY